MTTDPVKKNCHVNANISCGDCRLGELCLPIALDADEINQLDEIIHRGRVLNKDDFLYRESDDFSSVYAVRSGSFKLYKTDVNGEEQITGLYPVSYTHLTLPTIA